MASVTDSGDPKRKYSISEHRRVRQLVDSPPSPLDSSSGLQKSTHKVSTCAQAMLWVWPLAEVPSLNLISLSLVTYEFCFMRSDDQAASQLTDAATLEKGWVYQGPKVW